MGFCKSMTVADYHLYIFMSLYKKCNVFEDKIFVFPAHYLQTKKQRIKKKMYLDRKIMKMLQIQIFLN